MNTLTIDGLSKTYPNGVKALHHIHLTISNGLFGLLGPNGAGKSSLMRTLATLQEPTNGTVFFNNVDIIENPQELRSHLGYLPQEFGVYPKISAYALLDHIAILKGIQNKSDRENQINALLQQTNLHQHRKKMVHTFSGGMRQRFGIAQALLGNPKLIIVDEPTAGLDPEERNRFHNLLSAIGEHIIVLLSTHIVDDVKDLCSNMAIMNEGKIIVKGMPSQLIQKLEGKVWQQTIKKKDLETFKRNYTVLSTHLHAGEIRLRILSEDKPNNHFESVLPNLEDVYFSTLLPKK